MPLPAARVLREYPVSVDRTPTLPHPRRHTAGLGESHPDTDRLLPEPTPELSIRITDNDEAADLNQTYRAKAGPTNVLSFPADVPAETALAYWEIC